MTTATEQQATESPPAVRDDAYWRSPYRSMGELCERAEELCQYITAPELDGMPVYVVANSMVGRKMRRTHCFGWTSDDLDLFLKHELRKRWRGRGVAMLLNDHSIRQFADDLAEAVRDVGGPSGDVYFLKQFLATTVHELAHILDRAIPFSSELDAAEIQKRRVEWVPSMNDRDKESPSAGTGAKVPWNQHEVPFIRMAIHLDSRARRRGCFVRSDWLAAGEKYRLSPFAEYRDALRDELNRHEETPFHEIRRLPPPAEFVDLFARDVAAYEQSIAAEKSTDESKDRNDG